MHQILKQSRNKVYNVQQCKRRSCLWKIILIILNFNAPLGAYSCYKITKTRIQISRKNWTCFFSNTIHQMMILLTAIDSWPKTKGHKHQENKKLPWNSRLDLSNLTNNDQMLILCLSYSILLHFQIARMNCQTHYSLFRILATTNVKLEKQDFKSLLEIKNC